MLSAEQAVFPDAEDALDRLAYLVGPLLLPLSVESRITSQILSEIIEDNFGLKLPTEVSQTLLFRLAKRDFVTQTHVENSSIFYGVGAEKVENTTAIEDLIKDFRIFVVDRALLPKISDEDLLELFMQLVFELDEVSGAVSDTKKTTKETEKWKKALISDYVLAKSDGDGHLPPLLTKLAELCLLRSVVTNLTGQKVRTANSKMIVLLDAPLALYAIGASGKKQQASVEATLAEARNIGIRTCILPISFNEMTRVLKGVLDTPHIDRRGPTAAAIRAQEVSETIAENIKDDPEKYTKIAEISTLPRTLNLYPSEVDFFDEYRYQEFSAIALRWSKTDNAAKHDAEALTIVMRARKKKHERNLFYNSYVFVTRNWTFANSAKKYCLDVYAINENVTPPVIDFSFFSASIWVASGFPSAARLPEKTLLAACEKTLNGQSGVIAKAAKLFQEFNLTDEKHLQAYLQDRDCIGAIVKETYNDPSLIDENNITVLFEKVKIAAAGEVLKRAKAEKTELEQKFSAEREGIQAANEQKISIVEDESRQEREKLEGSIKRKDESISLLKDTFEQRDYQRRISIVSRVERLNKTIQKRNLIDFLEFSFFTLSSLLVCFQISLKWGIGAFVVGYAFVTFSYFERWYPYRIKKKILCRHSMNKLRKEFSNFEISEWRITLNDDFQFDVGKDR